MFLQHNYNIVINIYWLLFGVITILNLELNIIQVEKQWIEYCRDEFTGNSLRL